MKYWFKNVADNIYIYPKSAPRNLILQTRTSDCNSAKETAEYQNDISLTQNMDELEKTNYMLSLLKVSSQTHTFHILPTLHYRGGSSSSLKNVAI